MQTGAKLPMEQWQTPPRDLTSLRAWYSGAAEVPGAPPAPEWGKRTPTYSRLNPPPPRQMQAPQQRSVAGIPVGPRPFTPPVPSSSQLPATPFIAPTGGLPAAAPARVAPETRQALRPAEMIRQVQAAPTPVAGAQQLNYLTQTEPAPARPKKLTNLAAELLAKQVGGAVGSTLNAPQRTVGESLRDQYLAVKAGLPQAGAAALNFMDVLGRSATAGAPVGQPGATYSPTPATTTPSPVFGYTARGLQQTSQGILGQRSPAIQMRERQAEAELVQSQDNALEQVARFALQVYKDPALAEKHILTNLPMMAPGLAAGKVMQTAARVSRLASAGEAAGLGAATAGAVGGAMTASDAQSSAYDNIKQALMARGIPEKDADQEAFRKSLLSFGLGVALGVGGGLSGVESTAFRGAAQGVGGRLGRALMEPTTELAEELGPLVTSNIQAGLPAMQNVGQTAGATLLATAPFAAMSAMGAPKVPDALQTETGPAVQPPTGQFGGVIPPSAERQAYETWTQAGGPRAPEAYQVLRKSRSLPGQLGLPPVGLPPVGMPEGQAPQRPTAPLGPAPSPTVTPRTQVPTQPVPDVAETEDAPFTFRPLSTVGRPEARPVSLFERPILQTTLEGQGAPIAQRIEEELPLIRDEYAETGRVYQKKPRKGEVGEEGPTAGNVRGEYGKLAYFMHRTPSGVLKKAVSAYDLEPTEKVDDAYEPVMNAIVADMQQIVPGVTSSDVMASAQATAKARRALPPEVANIWESWYEQFGQDRGFTESDLSNLKELTAGRRGPFFRPDVQAVMGVDPGDVEANKQTQTAIRQDLARLMKMPYDEISLTTVPPAIWQNWMSLRGLNDERQFPGLKAQMQEIFDRYNEEVRGVKPSPPSPPSAPAGAAPAAPTRPTPPPPAAPAAPTAPTAPSPLVTRYQSQVGRGVSRAPFAFQPRSYTEGVASIERARAEREEARQARERLKKGSPFAKARQAEEARIGEVIEGRRPEPPAATEPVTPKPTPPAPPAPAGKAVTPDAMKKAGIDVPFMESLAKKYGTPPAPVVEAEGINAPLGRAANMLERAASKSKSSEELAEILKRAQRMKAHRAVFAVAQNPSTDESTFEKAIQDKEANKYVSPSYWDGLRAKRAERAGAGIPSTPTPAGEAVTPPTPRKATPVKKESAPKPAAPTGQPITEKSLTERGWTKNSSTDFSGPNGERLERDANRRGEPWVYTDRSGNTESFASAREAIQGILSRPAATPAPETPVTPKTTKPRKAKAEAEAAPVPQTTQEEGSGKTEAGTSRLTKPKPEMPPRGLPLLFEFRRLNPNLITTLEGYRDSLSGTRRVELDELLQLRRQKEDSKALPRQEASRAFPSKAQRRLRELNESFEDAEFNIRATAVLARFISAAVPIPAREIKATEYRPAIVLPQGYVLEGDRYVYKRPIAPVPQTAQPIDVPKIQKVLKGLRSGPMVDFTTIAGFKDSDLVSLRQYALKLLTGREMSAKDATFKRFMAELATALNVPVTTPGDTVKAVDKVLQDIEEGVITASTSAKEKAAPEVPTEVRQIFDTLDLPQGKKSKTRKIVEAMHPDLGKKAIFVNDNIEQIIAEAEANGKVTKECP